MYGVSTSVPTGLKAVRARHWQMELLTLKLPSPVIAPYRGLADPHFNGYNTVYGVRSIRSILRRVSYHENPIRVIHATQYAFQAYQSIG